MKITNFSIDTGNICSTFGRVKDGVNSDLMLMVFTVKGIGSLLSKCKSLYRSIAASLLFLAVEQALSVKSIVAAHNILITFFIVVNLC